jgi:hypothetical protein
MPQIRRAQRMEDPSLRVTTIIISSTKCLLLPLPLLLLPLLPLLLLMQFQLSRRWNLPLFCSTSTVHGTTPPALPLQRVMEQVSISIGHQQHHQQQPGLTLAAAQDTTLQGATAPAVEEVEG